MQRDKQIFDLILEEQDRKFNLLEQLIEISPKSITKNFLS